MRYIVAFFAIALLASTASAQSNVCFVYPAGAGPLGQESCELVRQSIESSSTDWGVAKCAAHLVARGMIVTKSDEERNVARLTQQGNINDFVNELEAAWILPYTEPCGDAVLDESFGEECDDGNNSNGDGCDSDCNTE